MSNSRDMKLVNYKEYRAGTAADFTLTLCVANNCNQEQVIPSCHSNNKDCRIMPIAWSNKMIQILSLRRSQEERLKNYHALKTSLV